VTWLLLLDGDSTPSDMAAFEEWLRVSPANADAWARAQRMWEEFDERPDPLLQSMRSAALTHRASRWGGSVLWISAFAACLLLALTATQIFRAVYPLDVGNHPASSAAMLYESGDKIRTVRLADGSVMTLDARTRVEVAENSRRRDLRLLDGRAFFEVAHDSERPFVVATEESSVTATGTAFAVTRSSGNLSVVLARGRVTVATNGFAPTEMVPGQEYRLDRSGQASLRRIDVDAVLSWRTGYIDLHDVTIAEALRQLNTDASVPVDVLDPAVAALHISGRFRASEPKRFVQSLSEMYPVVLQSVPGNQMVVRFKNSPAERPILEKAD
jgi:transmembrane sensor